METTVVSCGVCTKVTPQKDCLLELRPCRCTLCKDCFIQLLWELRGQAVAIVCPLCSVAVTEHGGVGSTNEAASVAQEPLAIPQPPPEVLYTVETNHTILQVNNTPNGEVTATTEETTYYVPDQVPEAYDVAFDDSDGMADLSQEGPKQPEAPPPPTAVVAATKSRKRRRSEPSRPKRSYTTFDQRIRELKEYQQDDGTFQVNADENPSLYTWWIEVRSNRRRISPAQKSVLQSMGVFAQPPPERPPGVRRYRQRRAFEDRLQELAAYKEQHGDCWVPHRYEAEPSLGEWVKHVRRGYIEVTYEQRKQLTAIGFCWETRQNVWDREWKERLGRLERYRKRFGHTSVPFCWNEDPQLSEWCHTQRKMNKKGKLRADRKRALDGIGFDWRVERTAIASDPPADYSIGL